MQLGFVDSFSLYLNICINVATHDLVHNVGTVYHLYNSKQRLEIFSEI